MKCITILQPYAHLIVTGEKLVENRTWATRYRGPLLIHAGKNRKMVDDASDFELYEEYGERLPFGAIVGRAQLVQCLKREVIDTGLYDDEFPWLRTHYHKHGPWCWILGNIERFDKPVSFLGRQGLFDIPAIELEQLGIAA